MAATAQNCTIHQYQYWKEPPLLLPIPHLRHTIHSPQVVGAFKAPQSFTEYFLLLFAYIKYLVSVGFLSKCYYERLSVMGILVDISGWMNRRNQLLRFGQFHELFFKGVISINDKITLGWLPKIMTKHKGGLQWKRRIIWGQLEMAAGSWTLSLTVRFYLTNDITQLRYLMIQNII